MFFKEPSEVHGSRYERKRQARKAIKPVDNDSLPYNRHSSDNDDTEYKKKLLSPDKSHSFALNQNDVKPPIGKFI